MTTVEGVEALFAENLRRRRNQAGLSQVEVMQKMIEAGFAYHQSTVAKIETGTRLVRLSEAVALAKILDIDLAELLLPIPGDQRLRERLEVLTTDLREAERMLFSAEAELNSYVHERTALASQLAAEYAMFEKAKERVDSLKERLAPIELAVHSAELHIHVYRDRCDEAARRIYEIQHQIEEMTRSDGEG